MHLKTFKNGKHLIFRRKVGSEKLKSYKFFSLLLAYRTLILKIQLHQLLNFVGSSYFELVYFRSDVLF